MAFLSILFEIPVIQQHDYYKKGRLSISKLLPILMNDSKLSYETLIFLSAAPIFGVQEGHCTQRNNNLYLNLNYCHSQVSDTTIVHTSMLANKGARTGKVVRIEIRAERLRFISNYNGWSYVNYFLERASRNALTKP